MKRKFRVKEIWMVEVWTEVEASSKEDAEQKICDGEGRYELEDAIQEDYHSTEWDTFEEMDKE